MREHKYRAWDKITKQMCPVWAIHWKAWDINPHTINYITIEIDGAVYRMEHEVDLMSTIIFYDKNNKEIFEGDIVLVSDIHPKGQEGFYFNDFKFIAKRNDSTFRSLIAQFEVIGNIHENSELLK